MIAEMGNACLLMRTRLISRVITGIYDKQLRSLMISSAQFALLVAIYQVQPATRAEIGRHQHLDRSTLTRHLKMALSEGWAEESRHGADGRSRPILLTRTGTDLLRKAEPACRAAESPNASSTPKPFPSEADALSLPAHWRDGPALPC
jgi:DNA-binding MarR family transcriptional regulator